MSVTVLLKRPTVFASLTIALLASLSACAGSPIGQQMEQSLAPDPQLKDNQTNGQEGPGFENPNQSPEESANETPTEPSPAATLPSSTDTDTDSEPTAEASPGQSEPTAEASPGQGESTVEISPAPEQSPTATASSDVSELDKEPQEVSEGLLPYVEDVSKLGVLKPSEKEPGQVASKSLENPNEKVTRRDFARWLVHANNRMHPKQPGKFVHPAARTDEPAFQDVPSTDPDFPYIQGLAEAGVVPSPLSGDTNNINFGPDEPLTRQQMILWKVHLDTREPFPTTTVENVNEAWGFKDASKIDADALGAVMLDFSSGDFSNIRRVYGYTSLFHPKFPVTRAEAAASLWYFGFQGDGVSAEEMLKANSSS